jgi:hypothetical protein
MLYNSIRIKKLSSEIPEKGGTEMKEERFLYLCDKSQEGREDVFVNHPATGEGGEVLRCEAEHLIVRTAEGAEKSWDYRECDETLSRRQIFPYR